MDYPQEETNAEYRNKVKEIVDWINYQEGHPSARPDNPSMPKMTPSQPRVAAWSEGAQNGSGSAKGRWHWYVDIAGNRHLVNRDGLKTLVNRVTEEEVAQSEEDELNPPLRQRIDQNESEEDNN